jgi:hypothetical protein
MIGYHFIQIVIVWSMYSNSVYYLYIFIYSLHLPLQWGRWEVRYHTADLYAEKISIKTAETTEIFQYLQV